MHQNVRKTARKFLIVGIHVEVNAEIVKQRKHMKRVKVTLAPKCFRAVIIVKVNVENAQSVVVTKIVRRKWNLYVVEMSIYSKLCVTKRKIHQHALSLAMLTYHVVINVLVSAEHAQNEVVTKSVKLLRKGDIIDVVIQLS